MLTLTPGQIKGKAGAGNISMAKLEKIIIFNSLFRPLPKLKMFLKAYSESPFNGDLKNGITINFLAEAMEKMQFSFRNFQVDVKECINHCFIQQIISFWCCSGGLSLD